MNKTKNSNKITKPSNQVQHCRKSMEAESRETNNKPY